MVLVEKCLVVKGLFREVGLCHSSRDNGMVDVLVGAYCCVMSSLDLGRLDFF